MFPYFTSQPLYLSLLLFSFTFSEALMLDATIGRATSTADAGGNTYRSDGYVCVTDARSSDI